jgi:hypothetical protein
MRRSLPSRLPILLCGCALLSCAGDGGSSPSPHEQWQRAVALWQAADESAYDTWTAIDPGSAYGEKARRLLAEADAHYRKGIGHFRAGSVSAAREEFARAVAIAPIDPDEYFPLAQICEKHGLNETAAKYYGKYVGARPAGPRVAEARANLSRIVVLGDWETPGDRVAAPQPRPSPFSGPVLAGIACLLVLAALGVFVAARRGLGVSLAHLIDRHPELHTAIAYLIGSLRHELLKHRIGAVRGVLSVLQLEVASPEQRTFLHDRLYGGVRLEDAWRAHLTAFERALGHRLNLRLDREFRVASRAIGRIVRIEGDLAAGRSGAALGLARAQKKLLAFDLFLSAQQARLVRTTVDQPLLRQVCDEVRGEYATSSVALDELNVAAVERSLQVEVPREDLVLILKNILRNAILAVADRPSDRRVGIFVQVDLEPTGVEAVRIRICDTNEDVLLAETIRKQSMDSGLGLVAAAVRRYRGAIEVRPCPAPFAKEVTVRFFKAYPSARAEGKRP